MSRSLTPSQQAAIGIAPIPAAVLSIISAAAVSIFILSSRERLAVGYHRIILATSVYIILHSSALCFGSTPIPTSYQPHIYGARGTIATCEAQGFIQYLARFGFTLYYCSLPVVVLSRLQSNFEETSRTRCIELCVHLTCNIIPWIISLIALNRNYINPVSGGAFCGINVYPDTCLLETGGSICVRGDHRLRQLFLVSVSFRMTFFCISFVFILIIRFGYNECSNMKRVAFYQAVIHLSAVIIASIIPWLFFVTDALFVNRTFSSIHKQLVLISLWPSVGIPHMIAYFILRPTWTTQSQSAKLPTTAHSLIAETEDSQITVRQSAMRRFSLIASETGVMGHLFYQPLQSFQVHKRWIITSIGGLKEWRIREMSTPQQRRGSCIELGQDQSSNNQMIFDGTNPSRRWSAFVLPCDTDLHELEEDEEGKYYSDICQEVPISIK